MTHRDPTLSELQLDLALAFGSSLDLEVMLDAALDTLLRRIGAHFASVYARDSDGSLRLITALPQRQGAPAPPSPGDVCACAAHAKPEHQADTLADGAERHRFCLPGFGVLLFERHGAPLTPPLLGALEPMMERLGRAARACAAHAALGSTAARLTTMVETLPGILFTCRLGRHGALTFEYVSPQARDVIGVAPEALLAQPEALFERLAAEDCAAVKAALDAAAVRHAPFDCLARIDNGSPKPCWLLIAGSPIGANGERWSGMIQDVTARPWLLDAQRENVHKDLADILSMGQDAIIGADGAGQIIYWNAGAERMLGHPERAAIGQPLRLIIPAQLRSAHARGMSRHMATGETNIIGRPVSVTGLHADGRELPIELMVNRIERNGEVFFYAILRDLTERQERERARDRLVEEERRFADALLQIGQAAMDEPTSLIQKANALIAATLGVQRVSLWSLDAASLTCIDLFELDEQRHSSGLVLEEGSYLPYFDALRRDQWIAAPDARTHPSTACFRETYLEPMGIVSMLDIPLRTLDNARGVLCIESTEQREWRSAETRFCADVANVLTQAIARRGRIQSEILNETILSSIAEGVISCDARQKIRWFNPVAEALTGWSSQEAIGQPIDKICILQPVTPSDPTLQDLVSAVFSRGHPQAAARRMLVVHRNGAHITVEANVSPIIEQHDLLGVVLTLHDMREEDLRQQTLERQNLRLRALGDAIPDVLISVSMDGRIHYAQEALSPEGGSTPDKPSPTFIQELFSEDISSRLIEHIKVAIATEKLHVFEYSVDLPEGVQQFEARIARMSADEATVLVRNVTAERNHFVTLQQERTRLDTLLSSTSALIYSANAVDFKVDYISESATLILGYPTQRFKDPGFWSSMVHPEDYPRVISGLSRLFEMGHHTHEYRHRHADGGYRWLRDEIRLIGRRDAPAPSVVGASFDITDRKLGESRLAALLAGQQIVSRISTSLLDMHATATGGIVNALASIGRHYGADRAYICQVDGTQFSSTHEWYAEGARPERAAHPQTPSPRVDISSTPLAQGKPIYLSAATPASTDGQPDPPKDTHAPNDTLGSHQAERVNIQAHPPRRDDQLRRGGASSVGDTNQTEPGCHDFLNAQGLRNVLAVPMILEGKFRGFIALENLCFEPLSHHEVIDVLQLLADAIGRLLQRIDDENALRELNATLTRKAKRMRLLLELSNSVARATSRAEFFTLMLRRVRPILGLERGGERVWLLQKQSDNLYYDRLLDFDPDHPLNTCTHDLLAQTVERALDATTVQHTAARMALVREVPITTHDHPVIGFTDWRVLYGCQGYNQFVAIPLFGTTGVFGSMSVCFTRPEPPSAEEMDWISQFGAMLAVHLSIYEAREALQNLNLALESRVESRTAELRSSEERFERLFHHAPQAMLIIDGMRRVVQSNRNAQQMFQIDRDAFIGTPISALVPTALRDRHEQLMHQVVGSIAHPMAGGRQVQALRSDNTLFWVDIELVPIVINGQQHILAGITDITARLKSETSVKRSLMEKETLLKEIHHRVKNNLQIISSLLMLQSEQMPSREAQRLLQESVYRIHSIALIHQQLYGVESLAYIDLGDYVRLLAESLRTTLAPSARMQITSTTVEVTVETAIPLALILNELLTNAFKYGLRQRTESGAPVSGRTGEHYDIIAEIGVVEDWIRVAVIDSGQGPPTGFNPERSASLGLQLIRSLNRQLRGTLSFDFDQGSCFVVTCPRRYE